MSIDNSMTSLIDKLPLLASMKPEQFDKEIVSHKAVDYPVWELPCGLASNNMSILHFAAQIGNIDLIEHIVKIARQKFGFSFSLDIPDSQERTPLMFALNARQFNVATKLVKLGANINTQDINETVLYKSIKILRMHASELLYNQNDEILSDMVCQSSTFAKHIVKLGAQCTRSERRELFLNYGMVFLQFMENELKVEKEKYLISKAVVKSTPLATVAADIVGEYACSTVKFPIIHEYQMFQRYPNITVTVTTVRTAQSCCVIL